MSSGNTSDPKGAIPATHQEPTLLSDDESGLGTLSLEGPPGDGSAPAPAGKERVAIDAPKPSFGTIDRFQATLFHAAGGMGEVWKGKDLELGRQVALKVLGKHQDQASRERFLWEAEITGNLEHPGIVPVYGLGRCSLGRPYYAMRFIHGATLKEEIDTFHQNLSRTRRFTPQDLGIRKLLGIFVDACNAVGFAHGENVLHRDIKPANIMVGQFGETLVVDWGLAKRMGGPERLTADMPTMQLSSLSSSSTQLGSTMGTPAYMSPEQADGQWDKIDERADVYSLGACLYQILTGVPPFRDRELTRLLNRVLQGDFAAPHDVSSHIPKSLSLICLKAMALKPSDRYPSAVRFGQDVERWMADQAVEAVPETWWARAARWIRHHATQVFAGSMVVAILLLATVAVSISNSIAARERSLALSRLDQARSAVDVWLTEAADLLQFYPGVQAAREKMLFVAAEHYETLRKQGGDITPLQLEQARIYQRLGDVQRLLRKYDDSERNYQKAEGLLRALDSGSTQAEVKASWAQCCIRRALLCAELDKPDDALKILEATRAELQGDALVIQEAIASCLTNEGSVLNQTRNLEAAQNRLADAVKICRRVTETTSRGSSLDETTTYARRLRLLGNAQASYGHCLAQRGDLPGGRTEIEEAVRIFRQLLELDAAHPGYLDDLAQTRLELCDVLRRQSDDHEAVAQYQRSIEDYERLSAALPDVPLMLEKLAIARLDLAQLRNEMCEPSLALHELDLTLVNLQKVKSLLEETAHYQLDVSAFYDCLGESQRELNFEQAKVIASHHFSQEAAVAARERYPREATERFALAQSHEAQVLEKSDEISQLDQAAELYADSLKGLESAGSNSLTAQNAKAMVHALLGDLLSRRSEGARATEQYRLARTQWEDLLANDDASAAFLNYFAWFLANCPDPAIRDLDRAERLIDRAIKMAPPNKSFLCTQAVVYYRQERYRQSAELLEPLAKDREGSGGFYGNVLALLAMNRYQLKEPTEGDRLLDECSEWRLENLAGNRTLRRLIEEARVLATDASRPGDGK